MTFGRFEISHVIASFMCISSRAILYRKILSTISSNNAPMLLSCYKKSYLSFFLDRGNELIQEARNPLIKIIPNYVKLFLIRTSYHCYLSLNIQLYRSILRVSNAITETKRAGFAWVINNWQKKAQHTSNIQCIA